MQGRCLYQNQNRDEMVMEIASQNDWSRHMGALGTIGSEYTNRQIVRARHRPDLARLRPLGMSALTLLSGNERTHCARCEFFVL